MTTLHGTVTKTPDAHWDMTLEITYTHLDDTQLGIVEKLYLEFLASLPEKVLTLAPPRRPNQD